MADEIRFEWDEENRGHIARHGVEPAEAEYIILNGPLELKPQMIAGEERFPNVGLTATGRWLVVVITERRGKIRVVTAFDADRNLIAMYLREKWGSL